MVDFSATFAIRNLILIAFTISTLTVCENTKAENKEITHITILSDEWQGYTNKDGSGAYWEVVKAIFSPLGITVNHRVMPWARAEMTVKNHQADALLGSYYQDNQQDKLIFPKWHLSMEDPIVALFKTTTGITLQDNRPTSFEGKELIWVRGYKFDETLFKNIAIKKNVITQPKQALVMLNLNRVEAFIDYESNIREAAKKEDIDLNNQYEMPVIKKGNKLYIAFANTAKGKALAKAYDQQMSLLIKKRTIQAIYTKWGLTKNKFLQ